jgi:hypothetical protein
MDFGNAATQPKQDVPCWQERERLDEAIAMVTPFLDPLLAGSARGRWDPQNAQWTS